MRWFRVSLRFPPGSEESVWGTLYGLECIGIEEPAPGACHAYFEDGVDPSGLIQALNQPGILSAEGSWIPVEDWHRRWMESYTSFRVGPFFVRPRWRTDPVPPGTVEIVMDPQQAFGTGTHATTQLCLEALAGLQLAGSMLDLGCGSGILSIAARKLAPDLSVAALDNDWQACVICRQNLAVNGVDFPVLCGTLDAVSRTFDVIAANLQLSDLVALRADLHRRLRPGGRLLLSGILAEQRDVVEKAYGELFRFAGESSREEWMAFLFHPR